MKEWEAAKAAAQADIGRLTEQTQSVLATHENEVKADRAQKAREELANKLEPKRPKRESVIPDVSK